MSSRVQAVDRSPEPEWLPVSDPVGRLTNDLLAVRPGGAVFVLCGEAHPDVYNDDRVLETMRYIARTSGAEIQVSTGPLLLVDQCGGNGLLQLAADGVIRRLYHRPNRGHVFHFRLVETVDGAYRFYREGVHAALQPLASRLALNTAARPRWELQARAEAARRLFESYAALDARLRAELRWYLPLRASVCQFEQVLAEVRARGLDFNYLSPLDLVGLPGGAGLFPHAPPEP